MRPLLRWARRVAFIAGFAVVMGGTVLLYALWQVPLPAEEPPLLQTTFLCTAEVSQGCDQDNSMAQLTGGVDRVSVPYERVPDEFIFALLATEDRDFFQHRGVSPFAVGRALWADLRNEGLRQGGSTITQQYVKNAYLTADRTWERKIREAVMAVKLERELPKQEILERYLNTIYWGRGAYGIQAAARTYFGKNVEELDLAESAYLAGIIRAPESADAQRQPEDPLFEEQRRAAEVRRSAVLAAMAEEGYITPEERTAAEEASWDPVLVREEPTNYGRISRPDLGTEYFVDYVRRWLVASGEFTDEDIYGGGLRIYTTLDMGAQEAAADSVKAILHDPEDPDAGLVAVDGRGAIRAMIGGFDFQASQVNMATGTDGGGTGRQAGSAFKPIALAAALEDGASLDDTYNSPARMTIENVNAGEDWEVANYADAGQGTLTLTDATRVSSNTAYAQLITEIGPERVAELAGEMGIRSEVPELPSIVLGTSDVSVLDMATAFSVFANRGELTEPYPVARVTDSEGRILWEADTSPHRVLVEDVADSINWALAHVIEGGTGTAAQMGRTAAGKTGTTENHRDAWFVGYTCTLTTAVWVGYGDGDSFRTMENVRGVEVVGGSFPAQIWREFMARADQPDPECEFERPQISQNGPTTTSGVPLPADAHQATGGPTGGVPTQEGQGTEPAQGGGEATGGETTTTSPPTTAPPTTAPTTTSPPEPPTTTTTAPPPED